MHEWSWCSLCEIWTTVCGTCGNNVCNGGMGEEMGPEPGTMIPCRSCESAYQMWKNYKGNISDEHHKPQSINSQFKSVG
jgi:hypothetical protein